MKKIKYSKKDVNWKNIPIGTKFTAEIQRVKCEGRITKDANGIYLCQNVKDGNSCGNNLEYDWSWTIGYGDNPRGYEVINLVLELDPKFKVPIIENMKPILGFNSYIVKDSIIIGCQTISFNHIEEVYNAMCYKQKLPTVRNIDSFKPVGGRNVTFSYDGKTVYFNGSPVKFNVVEKVYTYMCYNKFS